MSCIILVAGEAYLRYLSNILGVIRYYSIMLHYKAGGHVLSLKVVPIDCI